MGRFREQVPARLRLTRLHAYFRVIVAVPRTGACRMKRDDGGSPSPNPPLRSLSSSATLLRSHTIRDAIARRPTRLRLLVSISFVALRSSAWRKYQSPIGSLAAILFPRNAFPPTLSWGLVFRRLRTRLNLTVFSLRVRLCHTGVAIILNIAYSRAGRL